MAGYGFAGGVGKGSGYALLRKVSRPKPLQSFSFLPTPPPPSPVLPLPAPAPPRAPLHRRIWDWLRGWVHQ